MGLVSFERIIKGRSCRRFRCRVCLRAPMKKALSRARGVGRTRSVNRTVRTSHCHQSVGMQGTAGSDGASGCFSNYVLKYWLLRAGRKRRREFLQKLKSDLECRLSGKHVRTALLQLTTEPRVLLRQPEADSRYPKVNPVKPPKKFKGTDYSSARWSDEADAQNIKKKRHFSRKLFDNDHYSSKSSKSCQAQWMKPHRHDVKHMTISADVKSVDLKDCRVDSRQKSDLYSKKRKSVRNDKSNSKRDKAESLTRHKKLQSEREISDYSEKKANNAHSKEGAIWKKSVSVAQSSGKTYKMSELLNERIVPGGIRIPVQLNIAQLNINFTEIVPNRISPESRKEELSTKTHSPRRRDVIQTVFRSKNKHKESKSSMTDQDKYDSSISKKRRKRTSTEMLLNSPKRRKTDQSTSVHMKNKYIKKNILKKFRTYFGESRDSSEEDENRSLAKKRMRKKRDSIDYYDSGCGIDEDQSSPSDRSLRKVNLATQIFQFIKPVASNLTNKNLEEGPIQKPDKSQIIQEARVKDPEGEKVNPDKTKDCPNKDVAMDQLDSATKQNDEHLLDSNIPRTESTAADGSAQRKLQSAGSVAKEDIIVIDSDSNSSCEISRIDLVVREISEIDDGTVSPEPGGLSIVTSSVPEEIVSENDNCQGADNTDSSSPVSDSTTVCDSAEVREEVGSIIDNSETESVLQVPSNECTKEATITEEDPMGAEVGKANASDASPNVQNLSDDILQEDNTWMDDICQLLEMGVDQNCEILSDGNTVHIPLNGTAQSDQTVGLPETVESVVNEGHMIETNKEDFNREGDRITSENTLGGSVSASIRDVGEVESDELEDIAEFIQAETAPPKKSTIIEEGNNQVPETVINDSSVTEIVSTVQTNVPKAALPRLRVLTSGELGARWCPTPVPSNPVEAPETNLSINPITPHDSIPSQPPTVSTTPVNQLHQNSQSVDRDAKIKNRISIVLNKFIESVRYLRYLRNKNQLDNAIPSKHIREKQMNQNFTDFVQSVAQFRSEILEVGRLFGVKSFNVLVERTLSHLNFTEMRDMPLHIKEFAMYWNFDPNAHTIPKAINNNLAKTWTNDRPSVTTGVNTNMTVTTAVTAAGLQYNNITMTSNIASTISNNMPLQRQTHPTMSVGPQQFPVTSMKKPPLPAYHKFQGIPSSSKQPLIEEQTVYLPTPVTEYNEQMRMTQAVAPQNYSSKLIQTNRHLPESGLRNAQWQYSTNQTSLPRTWIPTSTPLNALPNQFDNSVPVLINPAQQNCYPMHKPQTAFPNLISTQVPAQAIQVQTVQHVAESRNVVPGNVRPMTSQTIVQPNVTYAKQTACQSLPRQSQLDTQENTQQSREINPQQPPVIQTSFAHPSTEAQNVSRISSGTAEVNNGGTIINNVPTNNIQRATLQHGARTANTTGMWDMTTRKENMNNCNACVLLETSPRIEYFTILQKMMLRSQIEICLRFPLREMQKFMSRPEAAQLQSHRLYLAEFSRAYKGFSALPVADCSCPMPGWLQNNQNNTTPEYGPNKVAEANTASQLNRSRRTRKPRKTSEKAQKKDEPTQIDNPSNVNADGVILQDTETNATNSGGGETQSTLVTNGSRNDRSGSTSSIEETLKTSNNRDVEIRNSQHDTQEVSVITSRPPSPAKDQVKLSSLVSKVPLEDAEKQGNLPSIRIILEIGKDTSSGATPTVGKSLPMLDETTSDTSPKIQNTKNLNSLPVLNTNTTKESICFENRPTANNDKRPVTLLPLCEEAHKETSDEVHEEPSQSIEVSKLKNEEEKSTNSSLTAKELEVSIANETEKTALDLFVDTGNKPIECINLTDTDISPTILAEDLSSCDIENLEISIESLSSKSLHSKSPKIISPTKSEIGSIKSDGDDSCEFQPNILSVRSISLNTFSQLKERNPDFDLVEPYDQGDYRDVIDIGAEDIIVIEDAFVKREKSEEREQEKNEACSQEKNEEGEQEKQVEGENDNNICLNCTRQSTVVCGRCLKASYCTKLCQESHWVIHCSTCKRHPLSSFCNYRTSPLRKV